MNESPAPLSEFRGPRRARGIAAVEFVITAPFVLLLLFGGAELWRTFVHYQTLSHLVRDSARFVSEHSINGTTGVVAITGAVITEARNLVVYGNVGGTGSAKLPNLQPGQVQVADAGGDNIRVTTLYPYQPIFFRLPNMGFQGASISTGFNMYVAVTMRAIS